MLLRYLLVMQLQIQEIKVFQLCQISKSIAGYLVQPRKDSFIVGWQTPVFLLSPIFSKAHARKPQELKIYVIGGK